MSKNSNSNGFVNPYTEEELKNAYYEYLVSSNNKDDNNNDHIYGYSNYTNHKLSMLQTITATILLDNKNNTHEDIDTLKSKIQKMIELYGPPLNIQNVINHVQPKMALAAEFKRASPSKGMIATEKTSHAGKQGLLYAKSGADIISVLTEQHWFLGSLGDLQQIREYVTTINTDSSSSIGPKCRKIALLRKDWIMNEYMIDEAIGYGGDCVLLIVAILPVTILKQLILYCRTIYSIEPLVEVHTNEELIVALQCNAKVIGVNNRNLHTFQLDMTTSERIAYQLQLYIQQHALADNNDYTLCALSGMSTCYDINRFRQVNIKMCLIGESLMKSIHPNLAIHSLCLHPNDFYKQQQQQEKQSSQENGIEKIMDHAVASGAYIRGTQFIKICGITNNNDALVACQNGANFIGIIFAENSKRKISNLEQAIDIVQTVRRYGERTDCIQFNTTTTNNSNTSSSLIHLIGTSRQLMVTMKQTHNNRCPVVVGVFQNQSLEYINSIIKDVGIDLIQLHGNEGMEACNSKNYYNHIPVIRVIDIPTSSTSHTDDDQATSYNDTVNTILKSLTCDPYAILLDTSIKGSNAGGGTGQTFDWNIVKYIQNIGLPVIIAGGLNPTNISSCIETIQPFGIDVSSGIEESPGVKDVTKLKTFMINAREAISKANEGF